MGGDNKKTMIFAAAVVAFSLLIFHKMLMPGAIRFCTDDNIGLITLYKNYLPHAFLGFWDDSAMVGLPSMLNINLTFLARWLVSPILQVNWTHACFLSLASIFFVLFLRERGLGWPACCIGALTAFWLGSNFTLVYAGHTSKFAILVFTSAFLWLLSIASKRGGLAWAALAGGAFGMNFVEQPDVAFFFALLLGSYAVFEAALAFGKRWTAWSRLLVPIFFTAFLFAVSPLWIGYKTSVRGIATMDRESPIEKWNYCTQWSWPPEESIDFIAPGFFGWRSGELAGPYWGRMGRSPGWEATGLGVQNFKLENQYLGVIPLILCAFALCAAMSKQNNRLMRGKERARIIFWSAAAVMALLLSFGKYFPLYFFFYQLPIVSSIRNPNKFLQIFQLAIAILAAYGFDLLLRPANNRRDDSTEGGSVNA